MWYWCARISRWHPLLSRTVKNTNNGDIVVITPIEYWTSVAALEMQKINDDLFLCVDNSKSYFELGYLGMDVELQVPNCKGDDGNLQVEAHHTREVPEDAASILDIYGDARTVPPRNSFPCQSVPKGLLDLDVRLQVLKRKEGDMFAQKKMSDGQKENTSQNEYKRFFSCWNFNLDEYKSSLKQLSNTSKSRGLDKDGKDTRGVRSVFRALKKAGSETTKKDRVNNYYCDSNSDSERDAGLDTEDNAHHDQIGNSLQEFAIDPGLLREEFGLSHYDSGY